MVATSATHVDQRERRSVCGRVFSIANSDTARRAVHSRASSGRRLIHRPAHPTAAITTWSCNQMSEERIALHCQPFQRPLRRAPSARTFTHCSGMATTRGPNAVQAIDFFHLIFKLKATKRTGWVRRGVKGPESIADHMYRMAMMAMVAKDSGIDTTHAMKVALAHDLAEAIVGDITPDDPVSKEEKYRREQEAMSEIRTMLGGRNEAAEEVQRLWQEYEDQKTAESHFVKDLDKLEMILQAMEYEQSQSMDLSEFFDSTRGRFLTETGKAWAQEIERRRGQGAEQ